MSYIVEFALEHRSFGRGSLDDGDRFPFDFNLIFMEY